MKEAELEATEGAAEQNSAETQSNGTAKEADPAQRNIACLSDANTAGGRGQREVLVSTMYILYSRVPNKQIGR